MKTAISIRDEIFEAAERTAQEMGISRSELYARAVKEFVARHSDRRVTERLNAVYGTDESTSALAGGLEALQFHSLPTEDLKGLAHRRGNSEHTHGNLEHTDC